MASSPIPTAPGLLSEADLKVSVLGPFIAALATVAGTCSFMLYALLRNPDLLARARAEADTLFADGEPADSERFRPFDAACVPCIGSPTVRHVLDFDLVHPWCLLCHMARLPAFRRLREAGCRGEFYRSDLRRFSPKNRVLVPPARRLSWVSRAPLGGSLALERDAVAVEEAGGAGRVAAARASFCSGVR